MRHDAMMAIYRLALTAVNQSKVACFQGAPKALLTVTFSAAELEEWCVAAIYALGRGSLR
jgi:hypothetical protein